MVATRSLVCSSGIFRPLFTFEPVARRVSNGGFGGNLNFLIARFHDKRGLPAITLPKSSMDEDVALD